MRLVACAVTAVAMSAALGAGVAAAAPLGQITEFTAGLSTGSAPEEMTSGPDGNLWFTDRGCLSRLEGDGADTASCAIGRITPAGVITEFTAGLSAGSIPSGIAPGPDGNLWFADAGCSTDPPSAPCAIGRITPGGVITEFTAGLNPDADPIDIAAGPDGNLWFTDQACLGNTPNAPCAIGRITPNGQITEFTAGLQAGGAPLNIVRGPDGDLWFTDDGCVQTLNPGRPPAKTCAIGRITPSGQITEFSAGLNQGAAPNGIAAGTDGNVWFTDLACDIGYGSAPCAIGRVTPSGEIAESSAGLRTGSSPGGIAAGTGGSLWFADGGVPAIGRILPGSIAVLAPARVTILTSVAHVGLYGALELILRCGAGSGRCTGTLTVRVQQRIRKRDARQTNPKMIRIGAARFSLGAEQRSSIRLVLTRAGRRMLADDHHHRLAVVATAVTKINTDHRKITLT
jgi:streptogramin lyase